MKKINKIILIMGLSLLMFFMHCSNSMQETMAKTNKGKNSKTSKKKKGKKMAKIVKTQAEWKKQLNDLEYKVIREKGTEAPFSGKYNDFKGKGVFLCNACGLELFAANTKFDSGTGWPSFFKPFSADHVAEVVDNSFGMKRVEVLCSRCDAHLGHIFDDGPKPTGLRYCINSVSLKFEEKKEETKEEK